MVRAKDSKTALFQVSEVLIIIIIFPYCFFQSISIHLWSRLEHSVDLQGLVNQPGIYVNLTTGMNNGIGIPLTDTKEDDPVRQGAA